MTKTTRRILFYSLVAVFVFATPPTILYAMGYSFDWQKYALIQTGGVYLKSVPSTAQIIANGKDVKSTPRLLTRLRPGRYDINISKDGFHSWQKTLEVFPQLVTEARNIVLFPKQIKPESIAKNVTTTIEYYLSSPQERQAKSQAQKVASSTAGWLLINNNIFYISENNFILYQTDLSGALKQQISKEALPTQTSYQIISSHDGKIFLALSPQGDLYWLNTDSGIFANLGSQIKNAQIASDNKKMLYATDNEIRVIYFQDVLTQPYKKAGDKELITRYAQPISQTIFYPGNEHVAFVVGDQIKIIELDGRDRRNTIDFIQAPNPQIYFDSKNTYLYYLTQNQLFRVRLEE